MCFHKAAKESVMIELQILPYAAFVDISDGRVSSVVEQRGAGQQPATDPTTHAQPCARRSVFRLCIDFLAFLCISP